MLSEIRKNSMNCSRNYTRMSLISCNRMCLSRASHPESEYCYIEPLQTFIDKVTNAIKYVLLRRIGSKDIIKRKASRIFTSILLLLAEVNSAHLFVIPSKARLAARFLGSDSYRNMNRFHHVQRALKLESSGYDHDIRPRDKIINDNSSFWSCCVCVVCCVLCAVFSLFSL